MSQPIENYALISDCHSAALVSKDGSIDWLAFPCFDSAACFASLLGNKENGRWIISPKDNFVSQRSYINDTVVLDTVFKTSTGSCKLTDCLATGDHDPTLIRYVEGISGSVEMELEIIIRFDYGSIIPWVRHNEARNGIHAVAGPEAVVLYSPIKLQGRNLHTYANFTIKAGEKIPFILNWYPSYFPMPPVLTNPQETIKSTVKRWQEWASKCQYKGFDESSVKRSLLTLKALTYEPTGAIVASPTTSLPEELGGQRNWDYRYGWIRDSSFTLFALLKAGYKEEATRWEEWLLRAVAGTPSQVNIMYGIRGERRLTEIELEWLKGYENSRPVRIGNDAYKQFQLDVFGEFIGTSYLGRKNGIPINDNTWRIEKKMIEYICDHWREPDDGIWEVRGPKRQFTHSKLMAWVAVAAGVETIKEFGLTGDIDFWERVRDNIHLDICSNGYNKKLNSFVQHYGSSELDASLLMMAYVGFLPPDDPRLIGTVEAIQKNLTQGGHVFRYLNQTKIDGIPGSDGSFIPCSFWLVDNLRMIGRYEEAFELYQELQKIKNDVGLYAEEYSTKHQRMVGNFPQGYTHISQAVCAMGLEEISSKLKKAS